MLSELNPAVGACDSPGSLPTRQKSLEPLVLPVGWDKRGGEEHQADDEERDRTHRLGVRC